MIRRIRALSIAALVAALFAAVLTPGPASASGFEPSVAIGTVNGHEVIDGAVAEPVTGTSLSVTGSAVTTPPLIADAGASSYVKAGVDASLTGSAHFGAAPYTFAWSFEGGGDRFTAPGSSTTSFNTTGLEGAVTLTLTVTDSEGLVADDTVKLFVYEETTQRVLDASASTGPNVSVATGGIARHPFTIEAGSLEAAALDVVLSWDLSYQTPAVTLAGYNLSVEDPTGTDVSEGQGAEFTEPEDVHIDAPIANGTWTAVVDPYITAPDTYRVTADVVLRPANPLPTISTDGPWNFRSGETQVLHAEAAGGTGPLTTEWDLDFDGLYETANDADGVRTNLPTGVHFVAVKTTDASGYEAIEINAVRIDQPRTGPVVIAVADSGINVYHRDFRASTYANESIKATTANFTKHPSQYIPGYPANAEAKNVTLTDASGNDVPFAAGKLHPAADAGLWTKAATPIGKMFWIPGTKIIGVVDTSDTAAINAAPDATPILDDDGHGTASASVAVGNLYGYCPDCLLFFAEGLSGDVEGYRYSWVDIASNSFGSPANVGFGGLLADPAHPKANAERGQIALYAAGNGNANAFESPEQTYLSENTGADWIVRVGAVDKRYRKPIVGTGKPVDISSWGQGASAGENRLSAADHASPNGSTSHSGTSAATPYSAGVFGTVLGAVREQLGDQNAGQKNVTAGDGIIAKGTPLTGSPYLGDGVLTRAELTEVVFKTAEHDTGGWSPNYPLTSPAANPFQYVVEGYGIVEPASGVRALEVLTGERELPSRPAEDEFFAADTAVRDSLWGTWNGGGENSATGAPESAAAATKLPLIDGITPAEVATFEDAWALLDAAGGPFHDPTLRLLAEAQASGDIAYYLHHLGGCVDGAVPGPFMDLENSAGDDDGCGAAGTAGLLGASAAGEWETLLGATAPVTIPAGTITAGVIYVATDHPTDSLTTVTLTADGTEVGSAAGEVISLGVGEFLVGTGYVQVPFQFATTAPISAGSTLKLSLFMDGTASWYFGYEGDHASTFSFLDVDPDGGGGGSTGPLSASITMPEPGTVIDPAVTPAMAVGGAYSFPAPPATTLRLYPSWAPGATAGSCGVRSLKIDNPGADSACAQTAQALAAAGVFGEFIEDYPMTAGLPVTLSAGAPVSGSLTYRASVPDPARVVEVRLRGAPVGGTQVLLGSEQLQFGPMIGLLGLDVQTGTLPFSFDIPAEYEGVAFESLVLEVQTQLGTLSFMDRENGKSYLDLPIAGQAPDRRVEFTVNDPGFLTPAVATLGADGTWGGAVDATTLAAGSHTLFARAVQGAEVSAVSSVDFAVVREVPPPTPDVIQVQVVKPGATLADTGWVNATDLSADGNWSTWSMSAELDGTPGEHQLYARLVQGGVITAIDGPVTFTVSEPERPDPREMTREEFLRRLRDWRWWRNE